MSIGEQARDHFHYLWIVYIRRKRFSSSSSIFFRAEWNAIGRWKWLDEKRFPFSLSLYRIFFSLLFSLLLFLLLDISSVTASRQLFSIWTHRHIDLNRLNYVTHVILLTTTTCFRFYVGYLLNISRWLEQSKLSSWRWPRRSISFGFSCFSINFSFKIFLCTNTSS